MHHERKVKSTRKSCKSKHKKRWTHYYVRSQPEGSAAIIASPCGKQVLENSAAFDVDFAFTQRLDRVTCPRCIEELKKTHYHCPEHGFIAGKEVTFDEKCDYCGSPVSHD